MSNKKKAFLTLSVFALLILPSCSRNARNVVFDFFEEFEHAHKTVPKNDLNPAASWDASYQWNGWRRDRGFEKDAVLIPKKQKTAFLNFNTITKQKHTLALTVKSFLPARKESSPHLHLFINGHLVDRAVLENRGFQTIRFPVSPDRLFLGKNILKIALSENSRGTTSPYWLALKRMRIIQEKPVENKSLLPPKEQFKARIEKSLLSTRKVIKQRANTSLDYYVFIPPEARLSFGYSLKSIGEKPLHDARFSVLIETETGKSRTEFAADLDEKSSKRTRLEIDLSAYEGQIAKVSYCFLHPAQTEDERSELILWEPTIISTPWGIAQETSEKSDAQFTEPFNILVYLIDCLRPDHLPFFGYEKDTAPYMTEFAGDSIIFRYSYAQSSWTKPSVGTLFTGLHPSLHQTVTQSSGLFPSLETMAESLQKAGYQTAGISSNPGVKEYYDFNQGFDIFRFHGALKGGSAAKLNEYIFPILEKIRLPFFMYVHTMDVHRPYFLADEFLPPPADDPIYAGSRIVKGKRGVRRREYDVVLDHRIAEYDAAVRQNDRGFGELLAELKKRDLYDSTMVILMSDHGEELYDHGRFGHGPTLYQEVIQNLLVIKMPGQMMAGKVIQESVQEIDLFPTILDLTGQPIPSYLPGRSIKRMLASDDAPRSPFLRMIFVEAPLNTRKKALVMGRWKMIHTGAQWRDNPFQWELYDLEKDPGEKDNIASENLVVSEYMKRIFILWVEAQEKLKTIGREDVEKKLTEKDIEELRALGYIR